MHQPQPPFLVAEKSSCSIPEAPLQSRALGSVHLDVLDVAEEVGDKAAPRSISSTGEEVVANAGVGVDLFVIVAIEQVSDRLPAIEILDLVLQKLQVVICVAIDDGDADVVVGMCE